MIQKLTKVLPGSQPTLPQQTVVEIHLDSKYNIFYWGCTMLGVSTLLQRTSNAGMWSSFCWAPEQARIFSSWRSLQMSWRPCDITAKGNIREEAHLIAGDALWWCYMLSVWWIKSQITLTTSLLMQRVIIGSKWLWSWFQASMLFYANVNIDNFLK